MAVLVTGPWIRDAPEEYSLGTSPTKEPMVWPVNRSKLQELRTDCTCYISEVCRHCGARGFHIDPCNGGDWPGSSPYLEEPNPGCAVHFCQECGAVAREVESFDEQIGYEEQARPVRVTVLACGHEVVTQRTWNPT